MREKIEVRFIRDLQGKEYFIYDYMIKNMWGMWQSKCTYFSLEEAVYNHKNVPIEYNIEK